MIWVFTKLRTRTQVHATGLGKQNGFTKGSDGTKFNGNGLWLTKDEFEGQDLFRKMVDGFTSKSLVKTKKNTNFDYSKTMLVGFCYYKYLVTLVQTLNTKHNIYWLYRFYQIHAGFFLMLSFALQL